MLFVLCFFYLLLICADVDPTSFSLLCNEKKKNDCVLLFVLEIIKKVQSFSIMEANLLDNLSTY